MMGNLVKPENNLDNNTTSKRSGTTGGTSSLMKVNGLNQNVYMTGIDSTSNEDREAKTIAVNNISLKGVNYSQKSDMIGSKLHSGMISNTSIKPKSDAGNYNDGLVKGFQSAGRRQKPLGSTQNSSMAKKSLER